MKIKIMQKFKSRLYFKINKLLLIFFIGYFILQIFLAQNHTLIADEGTHALIGLFYKDVIFNVKNFHSIEDVMKFATDFVVKYPKISPYYPPLYDFIFASIFIVTKSLLAVKIFNILLTILTSFVIYKICEKLLNDSTAAFVSAVFFLSFNIIFYNADKIMADILQILTFSVVILYYFKLREKKVISKLEIFKLSILLVLAFLTKYFSIFLIPIIIFDSLFHNRKLVKYFLFAVILSFIIISPYIFLYIKFKFYKLLFQVATTKFLNHLVYFNIFWNFGIFIGFFVAISIIWFVWKNLRNPLITIWIFLTMFILLLMKDSDPRFAFILMPVHAISCGFVFQRIEKIKSNMKRNLLIGLVLILIIAQLIYNAYTNYKNFIYPINDLLTSISGNGNILIMSEKPIYSSVYILYGYTNNVKGNLFRPCAIEKYGLTKEFLSEWGIRYLIDQNNNITKNIEDELKLKMIKDLKIENVSLRLFETNVINIVDCNFVCTLQGKVCKGQGFSKIQSLINNSTSNLFE